MPACRPVHTLQAQGESDALHLLMLMLRAEATLHLLSTLPWSVRRAPAGQHSSASGTLHRLCSLLNICRRGDSEHLHSWWMLATQQVGRQANATC